VSEVAATTMLDCIEQTRERAIDVRRLLHRNPELPFEEHATAALVAKRCNELGLSVRTGVGGTGVLADLEFPQPGPTVLLRADMDALPIEEGDDGRTYRSQRAGVMHACGHDGHVAVALATAEVLAALRPRLRGAVRLCFQPAEEIDAGARRMIEAGAADGVDRAIGMHLQAGLPVGTVAIGAGAQWAGSEEIDVTVEGRGGHAGDPAGTIDAVAAGAEIVLRLEALSRSREDVVSVAQFYAGTAPNVTPTRACLGGTLRAFGDRADLRMEIERVVDQTARDRGASACVRFRVECPPVVCDAETTELIRRSLDSAQLIGRVEEGVPSTASDDMSRFLARVPGCYFRVGASDPDADVVHPHHHPLFDLDERSLAIATEALARGTTALLAAE
jgi:amidohydrolase